MMQNGIATLLIVDDENTIRRGLSHAMKWETMNARVLGSARNGTEAMRLIQENRPDIVITDICMPEMDGLEMIKRCRDLGLATHFIILSGYNDFAYAQQAIHFGVNSYLLKPVRQNEIYVAVEKVLEKIRKEYHREQNDICQRVAATRGKGIQKENFLSSLATGEYRKEKDIYSMLESLDFHLTTGPYQIVLFRFDLQDEEHEGRFSIQDIAVFKEALRNILKEFSPNVNVFDLHSGILGALVARSITSLDFIERCVNSSYLNNDVNLIAGVGCEVGSLSELSESYRTACDALGYSMYETGLRVFSSPDIDVKAMDSPSIKVGGDFSDSISEKILLGDMAGLKTTLNNFYSALFYITLPPPTFIRGMCLYLLLDVEKRLNKKRLSANSSLFTSLPTTFINTLPTFREIAEFMETQLYYAVKVIHRTQSLRGNHPIIEQAIAYLDENITNKLRVEAVASQVHLSVSRFASLFKEVTGETFRDYVLRGKVEKAKELLVEGNLTISEISDALGYEDYRSFYRAFKNYTGTSPSLYQNAVHSVHEEAAHEKKG